MSRSLFPIYPVGPHYLGCLQLSQLQATPPSEAPAPQPFPNVGVSAHVPRKRNSGGKAARATADKVGNGGGGGGDTGYLLGASAEHLQTATASLRLHACAQPQGCVS